MIRRTKIPYARESEAEKIARRTSYKFTSARKQSILNCLAHGMEKWSEISQVVGCNSRSIPRWIKMGWITQEEISRARISMKLNSQQVLTEVIKHGRVKTATAKDALRAAMFNLERKFPEEYAQKIEQRVKVEMIQKISIRLIEVIKNEVTDPGTRQRIADRLRTIYNIPDNQ